MKPQEIHSKYSHLGVEGHLLGAVDFARQNLANCSSTIHSKKESGDVVTELDRTVHDSTIDYFKANGISACILGEEGQSVVENPEFAILIDEIEGTQNAVNGLDYGINIAIARYSPKLKVKDLESAVVVNLRKNTIYVGVRGKGAYKIQNDKQHPLVQKTTDVYECPNPQAYTTDEHAVNRQEVLSQIFRSVLGPQPRSIDATGTRLVELVEGNIRAYGDWRNATKCWDVLPSALILSEQGVRVTDVFGFELSEAVFYDRANPKYSKDGGLNRRVGENFIAASLDDSNRLIFGEAGREMNLRWLSEATCMWDLTVINSGFIPRIGLYGGYGCFIWDDWVLKSGGASFSKLMHGMLDLKREAYVSLDSTNVERIVTFVGETYLKEYADPLARWGDQKSIFFKEMNI